MRAWYRFRSAMGCRAVEDDASAFGRDQSGKNAKQRGLAGAVGAGHECDLARGEGEVDTVEDATSLLPCLDDALNDEPRVGAAFVERRRRGDRVRR